MDDNQLSFYENQNGDLVSEKVVEEVPNIIDADDTSNTKGENYLDLLRDDKFTIKNFYKDYTDHTEEVLNQLLLMQSNLSPLKKGGDSIAFRAHILISKNRQQFTTAENTALDVIIALISSNPEDAGYVVETKEAVKLLSYTDQYGYEVLQKGIESLKKKPLLFPVTLSNGKVTNLEVQWQEACMYINGDSKDEGEYVGFTFTPTKFFRMLCIAASKIHGAFVPLSISSEIRRDAARNFLYVLFDYENYKEYPNAKPGKFYMSVEDIIFYAHLPETTPSSEIKRSVLKPIQNVLDKNPDAPFTFSYSDVRKGKAIVGFNFQINKIAMIQGVLISEKDQNAYDILLSVAGLSSADAAAVIKKYNENNRDIVFLTQAIMVMKEMRAVRSPVSVLSSFMDNGLNFVKTGKLTKEKVDQLKSEYMGYRYIPVNNLFNDGLGVALPGNGMALGEAVNILRIKEGKKQIFSDELEKVCYDLINEQLKKE